MTDDNRNPDPCPGPLPPYGVPISDAVAQGDIAELGRLVELVEGAVEAIANIDPETLCKASPKVISPEKVGALQDALKAVRKSLA